MSRDYIETPDLRDISHPLWSPKGGQFHEHFDRGHSHNGGEVPHIHRRFPGDDVLDGWPGPPTKASR